MPFQSCDHDHRFGSVTNYFHVGLLKLQLLPSLSPALFISIKFVKPLVLLTISETRSIQFISPPHSIRDFRSGGNSRILFCRLSRQTFCDPATLPPIIPCSGIPISI